MPEFLGSSNGIVTEWITPDLSTLFGGGTAVDGANVTVNTAWTFSGNNASCNITMSGSADGPREGYALPVAIGPLCDLLGITEAQVLDGTREIVALVDPQSDPTDNMIGGVLLTNSTTQADFDGGGGGYRGSTLGVNQVVPVAYDAIQDYPAVASANQHWNISSMFVTLPIKGIYCVPYVTQLLSAPPITSRQWSTTGAGTNVWSPDPPTALYIGLFAGGPIGTADIDMDIHFGARGGSSNIP